jgi:hypothetical protein
MLHFTRFLLLLLAGLLVLNPSARAQSGPRWARPAGGWRMTTGGTDYVYGVDLIMAAPSYNATIKAFDHRGGSRWTRTLVGPTVEAMVADGVGNLWVTGFSFYPFTASGLTLPAGGFVLRYGRQGNLVWGRAIGPILGLHPAGKSLVLGSGGGVVVAAVGGAFPTVPGANTFLLSYDAAGTVQWVQHAPGAETQALAADASGNLWLAGVFNGAATFGSTRLTRAWRNGFLARYSRLGQVQWAKIVGAPGPHAPFVSGNIPDVTGLAAQGNAVYLACSFNDTVDFEGTRVVANRQVHSVLMRYDTQGTQQWLRELNSSHAVVRLAVDATNGNALVGGAFVGSLYTVPAGFTLNAPDGDIFLACFSPQGTPQWQHHQQLAGDQSLASVAVDAAGNIYGTGISYHRTGTVALADTVIGVGSNFLVRYDSTGPRDQVTGPAGQFSLYPNPSSPAVAPLLSWGYPAPAGTSLVVVNMLGQLVRQQVVPVDSYSLEVPTANLARGGYLVQLRSAGHLQTCRLLLE